MQIYRCKRCTKQLLKGEVKTPLSVTCPYCKAPNVVGAIEATSDFDLIAKIKNDMLEGVPNAR